MNKDEIIHLENEFGANVYQKFPVCITRGKGAIVYDSNEKEYIDCMGGYGVSLIGHCHPKILTAIQQQSEKIITCHGSFYNEKRAELLEKLVNLSPKGLTRIFLSNSGAESIECALKAALKYTRRKEVISMVRGYHGKTLAALSATWNPKYRNSFKSSLNSNFRFAPFGKLENVERMITSETAAIIVEPIQGESGIYVAPDGFLNGLRELCNKYNIVMIFDEVQTGLGRTGRMWASEHWDVIPDIMCIAKPLAGGLPIGATIAKEEIMNSLNRGEHSSTFGGSPLVCAAACATLDVLKEENLIEKSRILGERFNSILQNMVEDQRILREVRGLGLMIGLESRFDVYEVLIKALENGVILLYSGKNIVRFLPPLVIKIYQLEKVASILKEIFREEENKILGS